MDVRVVEVKRAHTGDVGARDGAREGLEQVGHVYRRPQTYMCTYSPEGLVSEGQAGHTNRRPK